MKYLLPIFITSFLLTQSLQAQFWVEKPVPFATRSTGYNVHYSTDQLAWYEAYNVLLGNGTLTFNGTDSVYYYLSADAGNTWKVVDFSVFGNGNYIAYYPKSETEGWVGLTTNNGSGPVTFHHTTNAGATWTPVTISEVNVFVDFVHFFDNGSVGFVLGDPATTDWQISRTTDNGLTWLPVHVDSMANTQSGEFAAINDGQQSGDNFVFGTNKGRVFYTKNKGASWQVWARPTGETGNLLYAEIDEQGNVYAGFWAASSVQYTLYRRNLNETAWTTLVNATNGTGQRIKGITSVPGAPGVLVANFLVAFDPWTVETRVSTDYGVKWIVVDTDNSAPLPWYPQFASPTNGMAGQDLYPATTAAAGVYASGVLKYAGSPLTGLFQPEKLDVQISISPNPTVQAVQVSAQLPDAQPAWLLVNDVSGRLIERIGFDQTAEINHRFDLSAQPAGVYIITLTTPAGSKSEKVVKQ